MAFDLNFLGRVSSTANEKASVIWSYLSESDNKATIGADGYFNKAMGDLTNGVGRLSVNDVIYSHSTNGHHMRKVTAVVGNVTTYDYFDVQGELGSWETKAADTEYTATQDTFVVAQIILTDVHDAVGIFAETPVGTTRAITYAIIRPSGFTIPNASITFPVRKGDTWKVRTLVTSGDPSFQILVMPLTIVN